MMQYDDKKRYEGSYNVGPDECDCVTTGELVELFVNQWGNGARWVNLAEKDAPHEAGLLKLDCAKIKKQLNWYPRWHVSDAVKYAVEWSKAYYAGEDVSKVMEKQINKYLNQEEN